MKKAMHTINGNVKASKRLGVEELVKLCKSFFESKDLVDEEMLFYTGYPLISTPDGKETVDAMLLLKQYGIVAFDVIDKEVDRIEEVRAKRDAIFNQIKAKLSSYQSLMDGRELAFAVEVVSIDFLGKFSDKKNIDNLFIHDAASGGRVLESLIASSDTVLNDERFKNLKATIQAVSTLKPVKKRSNAKTDGSKGLFLKMIEQQIANLDIYQNKAIVETTNSPQRITGLAGTGKTIVLAGKAAYLHACDPELNIVITFYSQSLYPQYKELIRRFYYEYMKDEPDWSKIHLLHAWGGQYSQGLYYSVCEENKIDGFSYSQAVEKFTDNNTFERVCNALLKELTQPREIFDIILIDEAQDMPRSFFEICYLSTKSPHRVVWAYDELQQLNTLETVPPPEVLFGQGTNGQPRFKFKQDEDGPEDDIMLRVCYRNPKEIITVAHALGLSVYHEDGPIQMIEEKGVWERIGYDVDGDLSIGKRVVIKRASDASPAFLSDPDKSKIVNCKVFEDGEAQATWIAEQVEKNIKKDELEFSDILIIYPYAYTMKSGTQILRTKLLEKNIRNHIAGAEDASSFFINDSVAISHIYRAKGNEAAIVYIMSAHMCYSGLELIKKRNILFTAITRARSWVNICGVGAEMGLLEQEVDKVKSNNCSLDFTFPPDLAKRRWLHRELNQAEKQAKKRNKKNLKELLVGFKKGEIEPNELPEREKEELLAFLLKDRKK